MNPSRAVNLFGATPQPDCRRTTLRAKQGPEHIRETWSGTCGGKPFKATHRFITSLRTTPEALL
jgi:hypothetical protein